MKPGKSARSNTPPGLRPAPVSPLLHPLDDFYMQAGLDLPAIEMIRGDEVPEPYRTLLVHNNDMTPTLEQFFRAAIHLEVLRRQQRDDFYYREVILKLDGSERPVEFGAIKINLALFPPVARRQILEERLPLGHILAENGIDHASRPKAFLRLESDAFINQALQLPASAVLHGRRNTLLDPVQRSLAEIVEVLPLISNTQFDSD
ncbi:MAG: hypothetical protein AB1813_08680 [Verrucomicrobiota bacterium]